MENTKQFEDRFLDFRHDLRNPLYIAKNLLETHLAYLEDFSPEADRTLSEKTKSILRKSTDEIERVLVLIRKLHQVAGPGGANGHSDGPSEWVSVNTILRRVMAALKAGHYLDHLVLIELIPSDLPRIQAHAIDLQEIFFNLIVNAAQATMPRGELVIEASCQLKPIQAVRISFEDTGSGISQEALGHIFEPFYTGRSEEGGVGFGLYIVQHLVERNGGQIAVRSKQNVGTCFTLTFPLNLNLGGQNGDLTAKR